MKILWILLLLLTGCGSQHVWVQSSYSDMYQPYKNIGYIRNGHEGLPIMELEHGLFVKFDVYPFSLYPEKYICSEEPKRSDITAWVWSESDAQINFSDSYFMFDKVKEQPQVFLLNQKNSAQKKRKSPLEITILKSEYTNVLNEHFEAGDIRFLLENTGATFIRLTLNENDFCPMQKFSLKLVYRIKNEVIEDEVFFYPIEKNYFAK